MLAVSEGSGPALRWSAWAPKAGVYDSLSRHFSHASHEPWALLPDGDPRPGLAVTWLP